MRRSVLFWYLQISRRATVLGRMRWQRMVCTRRGRCCMTSQCQGFWPHLVGSRVAFLVPPGHRHCIVTHHCCCCRRRIVVRLRHRCTSYAFVVVAHRTSLSSLSCVAHVCRRPHRRRPPPHFRCLALLRRLAAGPVRHLPPSLCRRALSPWCHWVPSLHHLRVAGSPSRAIDVVRLCSTPGHCSPVDGG